MPIDLDRYYTPEIVARNAIENISLSRAPKVCADSTCGTGRLLHAASEIFSGIQCVGIDRDKQAIAKLRKNRPEWLLAVGDLLDSQRQRSTFSKLIPENVDLLVLNPPFSHGGRKSVEIHYDGKALNGSIAMAHLAKSLELFKPSLGALVIAPESLLHSETDEAARAAILEKFSIKKISELRSSTFRGARANASVIQISAEKLSPPIKPKEIYADVIKLSVVRGALPVHLMRPSLKGFRYIHSTDIHMIVSGVDDHHFRRTFSTLKGRVSGWSILIPRVGLPDKRFVKATNIKEVVQLSDCVISLECSGRAAALKVEERIHQNWESFRSIYKGTGARYVTVAKLREWLAMHGIIERSE